MKSAVFLLGAGFNCDATTEVGKTIDTPLASSGLPTRYPLVGDLLKPCFGLDNLPLDKSVEELFQENIEAGNDKPQQVLYDWLLKLDYYIAPHLRRGGSHEDNIYTKFLSRFPDSHILTFNYDSLPELLLLAERSWCPADGYGVKLEFNQAKIRKGNPPVDKSQRLVLHLHGSLCVYAVTHDFQKRPGSNIPWMREHPARFLFDPGIIGHLFWPFKQISASIGYQLEAERVIAPIPDKAQGLEGEFIDAVYRKAEDVIKEAYQLVCIGYSFNQHDRQSYEQLLRAASGKSILVVSPDSSTVTKRLTSEYPKISWKYQDLTFKEWIDSNCPGIIQTQQ